MGGDSILEAVEKLDAGTIKKRAEGLDDLKRILSRPEFAPRLRKVGDDGWHKILDTLFGMVKSDKGDVLGGSATAKTRAINRLETTTTALKLVVGVCGPLIQHKTKLAVLDHVAGTLGSSQQREEDFRSSIQADYYKIFRQVLSDRVLGEHLRPNDWRRYVDFVTSTLESSSGAPQSSDQDDGEDDDVTSTPRGPSVAASARSNMTLRQCQSSNAHRNKGTSRQDLDELLLTLGLLSSFTNCPLRTRLSEIAKSLLAILFTPIETGAFAFECLNNVLMVARTESIELLAQIAPQVLIHIKRLWSDKAEVKISSLREQMLISLLLLKPLFDTNHPFHTVIDQSVVTSLSSLLLDKYAIRRNHECLQINDLTFSNPVNDNLFIRRGISPDLSSNMAILEWTTVSMIAALRAFADKKTNSQNIVNEQDQGSAKRQKIAVPLPELVRLLVVDVALVDDEEIERYLVRMVGEISNDRDGRSSWVLLVLSRLSHFSISKSVRLSTYWWQVWIASSQLITSTTNSRAACFTMATLLTTGVLDLNLTASNLMDHCFKEGTSGPPTLTDSALILFSACLRSHFLHTERQLHVFRERVLAWLDVVWTLPANKEHSDKSVFAFSPSSALLHDLVSALGASTTPIEIHPTDGVSSSIYRAYLHKLEDARFENLLAESTSAFDDRKTTCHSDESRKPAQPLQAKQSHIAVSNFLQKKLDDLSNNFRNIELINCNDDSSDRTANVRHTNLSIGMTEVLCTICTVASTLAGPASITMRTSIKRAWQCVLDYLWLSRKHLDYGKFVSRTARVVFSIAVRSEFSTTQEIRLEFIRTLRKLVVDSGKQQNPGEDAGLFSSSFADTQQTEARSQRQSQSTNRGETDFTSDPHEQLVQTNIMLFQEELRLVGVAKNAVPTSSMIEYVLSLDADEMISIRSLLIQSLEAGVSLTTSDANRLLRRVAEVCLQDRGNERNEAALCFCLKVLLHTFHLWINTDDQDLSDVALDIYNWFISIGIGKNIASSRAMHNIALILELLLQYNPRYGTDDLPSPRTSLLTILKIGPSALRYRLVPSLSRLFEGYVLTEHAAIFDDIVDCLPTKTDDREGIAVRLYILAKLGSTWRTCLRQATYHIFETAANVLLATRLARNTLEMMATEVGLGPSPEKLLHLFAPQIFYTWLEEGAISTIPFRAFGYEDLLQLVQTEKHELIAQTVLRQNDKHRQYLEFMFGETWDELLQASFPKVQVYAVSTDLVEKKSGADIGPIVALVHDELGKDRYARLAQRHLAETVAISILSLSDDRGLEKVLSNSNRYKRTFVIFEMMRQRGASNAIHPARQQPSYRAKYLMHILSKLCASAGVDAEHFWAPSLLIAVCRRILDDTDTTLGPLHVASGIRKVRIAVSLGGKYALSGYCLEMLLHNLLPYLTRFHCAEDTIGIYWYLLENGKAYLQSNLPFVVGLSISLFSCLSIFATSSQESTTQESQFASTMSKAKEFRTWLCTFFSSFDSSELSADHMARFQSIVESAPGIATIGSSHKHQAGGVLLYQVVLDQATRNPLVSPKFFQTIVRALSLGFEPAADLSDDVFGFEHDAVSAAPVLRQIISFPDISTPFTTWAGSVLGRAYAAKGPSLNVKSATFGYSLSISSTASLDPQESYRRILQAVVDLLWREDVAAASMAEHTMSSILTCLPQENRQMLLSAFGDSENLHDLVFDASFSPRVNQSPVSKIATMATFDLSQIQDHGYWSASLAEKIVAGSDADQFLTRIIPLLRSHHGTAVDVLPEILHLVLDGEIAQPKSAKATLSKTFDIALDLQQNENTDIARTVLSIILYLRRCIYPHETTYAQRNSWLDLDYNRAASAALACGLPHSALLMLEIDHSERALQPSRSRRSSVRTPAAVDLQLLDKVFRSVDDKDFFYGSHRESKMSSVVERLQHEGHGTKVLALQGALFDATMKVRGVESASNERGQSIISALSVANLHGLAYITQEHVNTDFGIDMGKRFGETLLNVHQWDVSTSNKALSEGQLFSLVLQKVEAAQNQSDIRSVLDAGFLATTGQLINDTGSSSTRISILQRLTALSNIQELTKATSSDALGEAWSTVLQPMSWISQESFDNVSTILLAREGLAAAMRRNEKAQDLFHCSHATLLLQEVKAVRASLTLARRDDTSQFCLNKAMYLEQLQSIAEEQEISVHEAVTYDIAGTLWSQGEVSAPIEMLRSLQDCKDTDNRVLPVSKAELLTDLGQKLSQARLERPEEVTAQYLQPAIKALGKTTKGSMAGRVYHNFAAFCDEQLEDFIGKDEFDRVSMIRNRKMQEANELAEMYKRASGKDREVLKHHYNKAKSWLKLDEEEYRRIKNSRHQLLQQCLENYLLSMQACDDYPRDVLRLLSLWLRHSDVHGVNTAVGKHLPSVPTLKMAPLVNQLTSRLLDDKTEFQKVLQELLYRLGNDHPHHSLYQIFAVCKSKAAKTDSVALSRHDAATKLAKSIHQGGKASAIWLSVHNSSISFVQFASEKHDKELKTGAKIPIKSFKYGRLLIQTIQGLSRKIPPPTMKIPLRPDRDYSETPTFGGFEPDVSIAGGVSAPKIAKVTASDGSLHKMLLKGGNDDLRQDAIMEQVFEQVSDLLQDHRPTRQRNLGIRTYKVIPLTHNAGIIEFVQNTMPLNDYLIPAHQRYYPKDYKSNTCRRAILDAQSKKTEERVRAFRQVALNFHPIMRFFFMEHFLDPDEWFTKRLNYSRSTAAISMLGHVLGLGDRHGHNILLDEQTGEAVHIDLGVAFEAGRVLPVPEVVPFRLTRDLVDGMGISGVEGPFRRCCNFTLEALRKNQDTIMTILDVLRWDPLHSWSVSPLRVQRMQEQQEREAAITAASKDNDTPGPDEEVPEAAAGKLGSGVNEPGEADRALAVVAKKLGAGLSVDATVNGLIREATDERNLAVLYCGWAAYA